ncbi:MAG TPA: NUDIX domain-containing protein [Nevskiaceae bacterium]
MRRRVEVACGVLVRGDRILIARRPGGKIGAGKWEFPGGKLEAGETSREALVRELDEELGVRVLDATALAPLAHRYRDRDVCLDTWRVERFAGAPHPREGQQLAWVTRHEIGGYDMLASSWRVLAALALPRRYGTWTDVPVVSAMASAPLADGAWVLLRRPQMDLETYVRAAWDVVARCAAFGARVIVDRSSALPRVPAAVGLQLDADALVACTARPAAHDRFCLVVVRDRVELARAWTLDFDAVVWNPRGEHDAPRALPVSSVAMPGEPGLPVYVVDRTNATVSAAARGAFGMAGFPVHFPPSAGSSRKLDDDSGSPGMR